MRTRFESPEIWPGFVDLFAGFALVVVASALSAQIVLEKQTEAALSEDRRFDRVIREWVETHRAESPIWTSIALDTSGVGRAKIALPGRMTFDRNLSQLKPEAKHALSVLAQLLTQLQRAGAAKVYVIGFADKTPVLRRLPDGSTNNLELSARRATNTVWYLTHELPPGQAMSDTFVVVSAMGDNMPIVQDKTINEAYSRRIEIAVHYEERNWNGR